MIQNFKEIKIGALLKQKVVEDKIEMTRICNFLDAPEERVLQMYESDSLDCDLLLRWSKLLEYDFFRIYSHHLILYSPPGSSAKPKETSLPQFRKNVYTIEIIDFMMELLETGKKTKLEIQNEYNIPKTTLYKWVAKHKK
ncbi:transposase [Chryseobacterium herbae]|uniref:Transposase n=1 Tax=Chryseobacterium herbae TaxID=2976476 RepID=A0ABT2INK8_9FLAO|nr:transposase [Chryseobacterium sp. pc1-10]MCT2560406.1 transposase [Chryseobacterium sp. pc1-10]